jgi:hypothetical protein
MVSMLDNFYRSGLLAGKILSEADMQTGRWDPNVSSIAGFLRAKYSLLIPVMRELKDVLVSL